ncbi:bifunctional diaminohydroxyphosphoribosylaminopyrimidine deaminase/5-amino-6-(5-phosphoribosylamino)uracil reductase RibD [Aquibium carbonis]|nr:bifunctional diaminohydroxyphosphoribosylaminopyrimidine deaminase/5-amino-6-(5-phosphoribosylamino)uracil reductase RibD [Aquibium carbonis]
MSTTTDDIDFMKATIRLARRNLGRTGTNPSVGCLIVRDGQVVGRGVTAPGGRPHAEPVALAEAGELARGATAYVTLEPCAHHGATPPCARTLISAGIARVVTAVVDPDERVNSKGHAMLREAGVVVETGLLEAEAGHDLAPYLVHKSLRRSFVTLKLAVSPDGLLGLRGGRQVAVTGTEARTQVHLMRAEHHAILIGAGTAIEDDPELTCRLAGLEDRSPQRIVLDAHARLHAGLKLVTSARETPLLVAGPVNPALADSGAEFLACEYADGRVALPELLEDLGARGVQSVLVEGGARVAEAFLAAGLVDRIALFTGAWRVGDGVDPARHVVSPITAATPPKGYGLTSTGAFGQDRLHIYDRA